MRSSHFLIALVALAGCGGDGGSSVAPSPTSTPVAIITPSPTPTPTIAPASKVIGGAPLTATLAQLSAARRNAQAHTSAQGVANGLPVLVESSGMVAVYGGTQTAWVTNVANAQDIPESGLAVTPSGTLALNNPAPTPLSCLSQVSAVCVVHPTAWEWGTSSANGKPVGKQTLTVAFADGATAQSIDYVYDGWTLPCNTGWVYQAGVPVATATLAASDVYADCVNQNIDFPQGSIVLANPSPDQYGRYETVMPSLTAAPIVATPNSVVSMATITQGVVIAAQTRDGGFAKLYFTAGAGVPANPNGISATGMSLHSQANGSFAF